MLIRTQFETLIDYHFLTSDRLLTAAAVALPETAAAVREKMEHVLRADAGYRLSMLTGKRPLRSITAEFSDIPSLQAGFQTERAAWEDFLNVLTDAELTGDIVVATGNRDLEIARWRLIQQVILHGMQHHAECAQLLTAAGESPGDIDFIFYRR